MRFLTCILFLFIVLPYCAFSQVSFNEFPEDFQLYKRNTSNTATVTISGDVGISSGFSLLILEIYKDNVYVESIDHVLSYNTTTASFEFSKDITAGLFQYSFRLKTDTDIILKEASNVVAGDIYIVTGQSNAVRHRYFNAPFPFENTFIRTYLLETQEWSTNSNPYTFGGIGYRFAASIVANQNIPVLLLNGGEGGRPIIYFQRNHENAADINTNYGQLLSRYHHANLTSGDVSGIIWFQGEADAFTEITDYNALFYDLYEAWEEDYAPDQYYIFQVRYGCTIVDHPDYRRYFQTPEALRKLGSLPKTKIISSNAILKGFDGCHYYETNGYENLASRLYNLVAYDFYNSGNDNGIYSPNIDNVRFTNSSRNQIRFDLIPASDLYTWQYGVENDFWIEGINDIVITDGIISGNSVILNLSGNVTTDNPKLSYLGHNPNDTPFIVNQNGIGMLSFKNVSISDSLYGDETFSLTDPSIYPNPGTGIVTIEWELLSNSRLLIYDLTGKKVYDKEKLRELQITIDVSNWAIGQYVVKIINQFATSTKRLTVN